MTNKLGITGKVLRDDDPTDPTKDYDMLGTMVCQHGRYNLGHVQGNPHAHLKDKGDYLSLPLYLMDHGGLAISTSDFGCRWDSGCVGLIYVTVEDLRKEGISNSDALKVMQGEVETYNDYLTGNCWGYVITDKQGALLDSCWGFLGDREYCESEMSSLLAHHEEAEIARLEDRDERYREEDWRAEVFDRNTVLGLEEWREHKEESDEE